MGHAEAAVKAIRKEKISTGRDTRECLKEVENKRRQPRLLTEK